MAGRSAKGKGRSAEETPASPMDTWISRARGAGALVGFVIAFWVCRRQGFDVTDAALRGLIGAVGLSLVTWWSSLLVIQALMRAAAAQTTRDAYAAAEAQAAARAPAAPPGETA